MEGRDDFDVLDTRRGSNPRNKDEGVCYVAALTAPSVEFGWHSTIKRKGGEDASERFAHDTRCQYFAR